MHNFLIKGFVIFLMFSLLSCKGNVMSNADNQQGDDTMPGSEIPAGDVPEGNPLISSDVRSTSPQNGAQNVVLRTDIAITLNTWNDAANSVTFEIDPPVEGSIIRGDETGKTVTFRPSSDLLPATRYTVRVVGVAFSFETMAQPAITGVLPAANAIVPLDADVTITFSSEVDFLVSLVPDIILEVAGVASEGTTRMNSNREYVFVRGTRLLPDGTTFNARMNARYVSQDMWPHEMSYNWQFSTPDLWGLDNISYAETIHNRRDEVRALAATDDHIYAAGAETVGSSSGNHAWFGKYTQRGTPVWDHAFLFESESNSYLEDIVVDGAVYMAGYKWTGSQAYQIGAVKYSTDGVFQWVAVEENPVVRSYDYSNALITTPDAVFIGGASGCGASGDETVCRPYLRKLNKETGAFLWSSAWIGENGRIYDLVSAGDFIYAVGFRYVAGQKYISLWKFNLNASSPDEVFVSSNTITAGVTPLGGLFSASFVSEEDSLYVAGTSGGKIFIQKYDTSLHPVGSPVNDIDGGLRSIKTARNGSETRVYVTGHNSSATAGWDVWTAVYQSSGGVLTLFRGPWVYDSATANDIGNALTVDGENIIVGGYITAARPESGGDFSYGDFRDGWIRKYNLSSLSSGTVSFTTIQNGQLTGATSLSRGVSANAEGLIAVGGFRTEDQQPEPAARLYDRQGNLIWQKRWGTARGGLVSDVAIDNDGNTYLCGNNTPVSCESGLPAGVCSAHIGHGHTEFWVAKINRAGSTVWEYRRDNGVGDYNACTNIFLSPDNHVYAVGQLGNSSVPTGTRLGYIVKLCSDGTMCSTGWEVVDDTAYNYLRPLLADSSLILLYRVLPPTSSPTRQLLGLRTSDGGVATGWEPRTIAPPGLGSQWLAKSGDFIYAILSDNYSPAFEVRKFFIDGTQVTSYEYEIDLDNKWFISVVAGPDGQIYIPMMYTPFVSEGHIQGWVQQTALVKLDGIEQAPRVINSLLPLSYVKGAFLQGGVIVLAASDVSNTYSRLRLYDSHGNTAD